MDPTEFEALRARCLQGQEEAWAELFRKLLPFAERLAMARYQIPAADAQDVAQLVMIDFAAKISEIRTPEAFVRTAVHNKCVDWARRCKTRNEVLASELSGEREDGEDKTNLFENLPGPRQDTTDTELVEALELLRAALLELKDDCRRLLSLRFFEQIAYRDLSERCSLPEAQVGVRLARCLGYIFDKLDRFPDAWDTLSVLCEQET